ncbi:hypothetical protein K0651_01865 [Ornithinimicrobium sp. Arc0846-15]|nr:hypothetical protein [Ornithinimicrobium laminariae]
MISNEFIERAMQAPAVRAGLSARADKVSTRAKAIAASEDVDMKIQRRDGTRPKGRPYSRVSTDNADQEWGTSNTEKRRVLGRAASG